MGGRFFAHTSGLLVVDLPRNGGRTRTGARAVTVAAAPVPATPPAEPINLAPPGLACSCCWSAAEVVCPATGALLRIPLHQRPLPAGY